jgi:long-chain acyl-CoA synthetase
VLQGPVKEDTLRALCAKRLSDYKVPESWTLTNTPLPRNPNGKVDKKLLRDQVIKSLAEQIPISTQD